jgi:hypothetical protein
MRMGVWEIMSIDRSVTEIRKKLGTPLCPDAHADPIKTILQGRGFANELSGDRSLELKSAESEQLDSEHLKSTSPNPSIAECRDCPEGMEW